METALILKPRFGCSPSATLSTPTRPHNETIIVEARDLTATRGRRMVLHQLNLQIAAGETIAILGANGAGKTTLLLCLAGLIRPASGSVQWHQASLGTCPSIGFLGHERGLYGALTVRENLRFAAHMHGIKRANELIARTLAEMNLDCHADSMVRHLSRGMGQRLALARALFHDPVLALLDEPFASLDAPGEVWLEGCLRRRQEMNFITVLSSHDLAHARVLANRTLLLSNGKLQAT